MSKLNSLSSVALSSVALSSVALASALALAPAPLKAAERIDTVKDENAAKIGGVRAKFAGLAGFAVGHLELAFGGHIHSEKNENAAAEVHLAYEATDNLKLGVKFQDDTHKAGPDDASLGGFMEAKFGRHDALGFDAGVQFKLKQHPGDVSSIAAFNTLFTGEFDNGVYLGGGLNGEYHPEPNGKITCGTAELGLRALKVKGENSLEIGLGAGPCSVDTGNVNSFGVTIHTKLIPHF